MATPIDTEIQRLTDQIEVLKRQLSEARRRRPSEAVADYALLDPDGSPTTLSALFGDGDDLIVIHNMGRECVYRTLWADGFSSLVPHLENRAAFVVISPDTPEVQSDFAASHGWTFRMASEQAVISQMRSVTSTMGATCREFPRFAANPMAPSSAPAATALDPAMTIRRHGGSLISSTAASARGSRATGM